MKEDFCEGFSTTRCHCDKLEEEKRKSVWNVWTNDPLTTHTTGVNLRHLEQTQGQTRRSVEGSRHTLGLSPHPSTYKHTFSLSPWPRRVVTSLCFYIILSDNHQTSCCASRVVLFVPCRLFISPMFPFVVPFGLLLLKQYTKRHDDTAASHPGALPLT